MTIYKFRCESPFIYTQKDYVVVVGPKHETAIAMLVDIANPLVDRNALRKHDAFVMDAYAVKTFILERTPEKISTPGLMKTLNKRKTRRSNRRKPRKGRRFECLMQAIRSCVQSR